MSTEQQNPSLSSYRSTYDAFLSFRGADTRKGFTDHLYSALELAGIHTFRDDNEIERGANIEQELQTAIQESRVSVIVFSKDYASSSSCLNELGIIMERKRADGHMVIPVFYDVEPSDVRKQTGSFAESFTRHEKRFKDEIDKVEEWRRALRDVADLGGMVLGDRYESQFIQDIVEAIGNKLDYVTNRRLRVDPYVIGRGDYVERLNMWLEDGSNDVGVAVIHGMGGIGKTTIAKIAYNQNLYKFQASSFLSDIRETSRQANGFVRLQRNLLSDIQKGKMNNIYSLDEGIKKIKRAIRCKRVLIVLDDVENSEQFNAILGMRDWFHPGSKIFITTRCEHLLRAHEAVRFKVKGLHEDESLELFSWHAFRQPHSQEGYVELSRPMVEHCGGVPLALQVLGSSLCGKTADVWKNALHDLDEFTEGKIRKILRISYDSLQDHDKSLFLHIACFFVGKDKDFTTTILDECDFATKVGLPHLVDRCLVEINVYTKKLTMHQLLQDMGRAISREESPKDPGERTRLWQKDAINVLRKLTGTRAIKGLRLNFPPTESFETKAFTEMLNLELLLLDNVKLSGSYEDFPKNLIWLSWRGFSLKSIPANFCMENLVVLDLRKSSLQHVWKGTKNLTRLKILNLSHSHRLRTTSDLSGFPNLEKLILKDCINLVDVDESIGNLGKLVFLNLKDCKSLTKLPKRMNMLRSLEELVLSGCSKLVLHDSATVIQSTNMSKYRLLSTLSWTPMGAWPGKTLQSTSFSLASLSQCLESLNLSHCNLSEVPNDLCTRSLLKHLNLTGNPFVCLPQNMKNLIMLETLLLDFCTNLEILPELPARLEMLSAQYCKSLKRITNVPNLLECFYRGRFHGCDQLVAVESLLNIKTLRSTDIEMTRYMSLFNLKSIGSTDVQMFNYLTGGTTMKAPIQIDHLLEAPAMNKLMAQSSSFSGESGSRYLYDVFLSFSGEDTRKTFVDHLCAALEKEGLKTFRYGNELAGGGEIEQGVRMFIEKSRCSIVVFSKGYASSRWCLDQLVMILERKKTSDQYFVFPVFYGVDPSNVRYQRGSVAKAFARHKESQRLDKVNLWRAALTEAANLAGMIVQSEADGHGSKFMEDLVAVTKKTIGDHLFGIDSLAEGINSGLQDVYSDSGMLHEKSGIGKTTIADVEDEGLTESLKSLLFLYCSLFPLDYEFKKYELVQLWIAEGFIGERHGVTMEDTGILYFNSMESEGFFMLSRSDFSVDFDSVFSLPIYNPSNFYKINTIKLSVLEKRIYEDGYFRAVDGKLDGASEMTKHLSVSFENMDEMDCGVLQKFKHLHTLLLFYGSRSSIKQVPHNLLSGLKFLRTLNLSGTLISELPSSIRYVKALRYLDVSHTPIRQLPEAIDSLHNLQTIKLRGCVNFVQLPKGIKKLTNLRHIELDIIRQLDSLPADLGNLTNLQTLSAFLVSRDQGCNIGQLENLNHLKGALRISRLENVLTKEEAEKASLSTKKSLQRVVLRWSSLLVENEILECLQPHYGLKELGIQNYGGSILPDWISNPAFADLLVVTLYRCKNCKRLPSLGQLPALKFLSIIEMNGVEEIHHDLFRNEGVPQEDPAFPKLERLEIDIMLNLKKWKAIKLGDLPSLLKLTVDSCPELQTLPSLSELKSLKHLEFRRCPILQPLSQDGPPTSLESLVIIRCPQLKEWCTKRGGQDQDNQLHVPRIWLDHEELKMQGEQSFSDA